MLSSCAYSRGIAADLALSLSSSLSGSVLRFSARLQECFQIKFRAGKSGRCAPAAAFQHQILISCQHGILRLLREEQIVTQAIIGRLRQSSFGSGKGCFQCLPSAIGDAQCG